MVICFVFNVDRNDVGVIAGVDHGTAPTSSGLDHPFLDPLGATDGLADEAVSGRQQLARTKDSS
jgi:hypothetical protein